MNAWRFAVLSLLVRLGLVLWRLPEIVRLLGK